jgi:hypothetical protein
MQPILVAFACLSVSVLEQEGSVSGLTEEAVATRSFLRKSHALPSYFVSRPDEDHTSCNEAYPLVSLKRRLVFCGSPKSGTTLWRTFLNQVEGFGGEGCCDEEKPLRLFDVYAQKIGTNPTSAQIKQAVEQDWPSLFKILQIRNPIKRIFSASMFLYEDVMKHFVQPEAREIGPSRNVAVFHSFICQRILQSKITATDSKQHINMRSCRGDSLGNLDPIWQHFFPQHCRCGLEQGIIYDMVVKLEKLPRAIDRLLARGGYTVLVARSTSIQYW